MAYTTIDDPSAYFQSFLYTGNGASRTITLGGNSDLKFDMYWYKTRNTAGHHRIFDTSRGLSLELYPDLTAADSAATYVSNQTANGFDLSAGDSSTNLNGATYANWQWKASGGTTASNTDGSITSTVQANTDAGFSIVTYTGGGSAGTIGHGLGAKPKLIILKKRNGAVHWYVRHDSTGSSHLVLSLTAAAASVPSVTWTTTEPTSSVFSIGSGADFNANGGTFIAYCWAEKQGYSKFGKYVGNGARDGVFCYLGFQPAFVIIKATSVSGMRWAMFDNKRTIANGDMDYLVADDNHAESDAGLGYTDPIDFVSNGFKIRNSDGFTNQSGASYIYMAFAENPLVTSTGVPTTAR